MKGLSMPVMPKEIEVPVMGLMKDATVKVKLTGYRGWMWRARVAVWLMWLAVWLTGMGCEVEEPDNAP